MKVELHTDGACSGNPGPGGWGALLRYGREEKELSGGQKDTTNNQMELMAVIRGLEYLKRGVHLDLYTDSTYVLKGATEWMSSWKKKGWKNSAGKAVKNRELWERLEKAMHRHTIDWHWVKGHSGNVDNERADELARSAIPQIR
ncbi:MAG: ribonuclease HI [Xanthomonadales bacterium]|nr:ribonuclease HI [Xanthomonadales bacterium]